MKLIPGGEATLEKKLAYTVRKGAKVVDNTHANRVLILLEDTDFGVDDGQCYRFNTLTQRIEVRDPPWHLVWQGYRDPEPGAWRAWTDTDTTSLSSWYRENGKYELDESTDAAWKAIDYASRQCAYHPIVAWLDTLSWDGTPRLDTWLAEVFGCPPGDYASRVGRWFVISMVARVMRPGCQVDHMLVLEGPQGYGKSSALRELVGPDWYSDTHLDLGSKDAYQALEGKWLIELGELASLSKSAMGRTKSFVTERVSRYRPPYARTEVTVPRQCVFVGTTNEHAYLTDQTGNRRFWPIRVPRPIPTGRVEAMREQLFAEAAEAFGAGERWHPTGDEARSLIAPEQDKRRIEDPWESVVTSWLGVRTEVTIPEILDGCLAIEPGRRCQAEQKRLTGVLQSLGWEQRRTNARRFWVKGHASARDNSQTLAFEPNDDPNHTDSEPTSPDSDTW